MGRGGWGGAHQTGSRAAAARVSAPTAAVVPSAPLTSVQFPVGSVYIRLQWAFFFLLRTTVIFHFSNIVQVWAGMR